MNDTIYSNVPAFYRLAVNRQLIGNAEQIFDYGCGIHLQELNDYAGKHNYCIIGYDERYLSDYDNGNAVTCLRGCNMIVCNNVLNTLSDSEMLEAIQTLYGLSYMANNAPVHITVPCATMYYNDIAQPGLYDHRAIDDYISILSSIFKHVSFVGGIITCNK